MGLSALMYAGMYLTGWTPYGAIWLYYWVTPVSTELDVHAIFYTRLITLCFLLLTNLWPLHFACYSDRRSQRLDVQQQQQKQQIKHSVKGAPPRPSPMTPSTSRRVNPPPSSANFVPSPIYTVELPVSPTSPSIPITASPGSSSQKALVPPSSSSERRMSPPAIPFTTVHLPLARPTRKSHSLKDKFRAKFRTTPTGGRRSGTTVATDDLEYRPIGSGSFSGKHAPPIGGAGAVPLPSGAPVHTAKDSSGVIAEFFEMRREEEPPRMRGGTDSAHGRRGRQNRRSAASSTTYDDPDSVRYTSGPVRRMLGSTVPGDPFGVVNPSFDLSGEDSNTGTAVLPPPPPVPSSPSRPIMSFYSQVSLDDGGTESPLRRPGGHSRSSVLALRYNLSPEIYSSSHTNI